MVIQDEKLAQLLRATGQFDVYKWSLYPEVRAIVEAVFSEVISYRKAVKKNARIRAPQKIKRHLSVLLLNLSLIWRWPYGSFGRSAEIRGTPLPFGV